MVLSILITLLIYMKTILYSIACLNVICAMIPCMHFGYTLNI